MTIDERLDRLTGRHEALTQSAELLLRKVRNTPVKSEHCATLLQPSFRSPNITNVVSLAWKKGDNSFPRPRQLLRRPRHCLTHSWPNADADHVQQFVVVRGLLEKR